MPINHFSSSDLPEALWWAQQQQQHHHHHHHKMEPSKTSPSSKHNTYNINIPQATTSNFWTNSHLLYPHHQQHHNPMSCTQNSAFGFDLNNEDDEEIEEQITDERDNNMVKEEPEVVDYQEQELIQKQPLFEKPLTPSDVGKLNRLVIPKQHAEKYFPLNGTSGSDSGEKGLLLSFEDELGKPWRFRYSYWNSSQSYVLTKGWSRFVKDKKLDAGDIVLFERHPLDSDRLFIGWRRRNIVPSPADTPQTPAAAATATATVPGGGSGSGGGGGWTRLFFSGHPYPPQPHSHGPALPLPYQPDCLHAVAATVLQSQTTTSTPSGNATSKRLRLFGVNLDLECQQAPEEEEDYSDQPPTPEEGSSGSSQSQAQFQYYHQYFTNHKLHPHMDINFSRDVNQTRYHQG